ncbi:MAG: lysostaphin resistance A-like protein [Rhodothermales bacterium]
MKKAALSPFVRLIISLVCTVGALLIMANVVRGSIEALPASEWLSKYEGLLYAVPLNVVMVIAYYFYVVKIEKRAAEELGISGAIREFGSGFILGAGLLGAVVGILWMLGHYQVSGFNNVSVLAIPFFSMLARSLGEELIFRVILFRITEEGLGTWIALLISSAFFGLAHLGNPAATWISTLAISLEAGVLLGAVYMVTRRLWMAWGVHFAWNFVQGPVFGIEVSGTNQTGLFIPEMSGPELITGGAFGVEASLIAIVLCFGVAIPLLFRAKKAGQFKRPFWQATPS